MNEVRIITIQLENIKICPKEGCFGQYLDLANTFTLLELGERRNLRPCDQRLGHGHRVKKITNQLFV